MNATVIADDLYSIVRSVIKAAEDDARTQARQEAEYSEKKAEAELHGDLEGFLLAQKRRTGGGDTEGQKKSEEDKKEEEADKSIEGLQKKVKNLQVQIRLQNVQILQTLNAETISMQRKMQLEVEKLVSSPAFVVNASIGKGLQSHKDAVFSLVAVSKCLEIVVLNIDCVFVSPCAIDCGN